MIPTISLRDALEDNDLLGGVLDGPSWKTWKVLLIAAMGERLTAAERRIFKQITQREREPLKLVEELVGVIGRRGGKSRAISVLATYISALCKHPALVSGERGVLLIIAPDQSQADICLEYIHANFIASPILAQLIEGRTQRTLRLTNRIDIEVRASDFRRLRGPTYIAVIADESAFWLAENSSNPDSEILAAVRPGLATTSGPLFLISSPYARRGELWSLYNKHFGPQGDPLILVAQGASRIFNPSLPQSVVDRAMERDPASAAAEYGAEFRRDIESFISIEAVMACVSAERERPRQAGITYFGFCDPSGGSSDSMTLAIGHNDAARETVVVDCIRERTPPFSPEQVVSEFSQTLKSYGISSKLIGDRYASIWPVEQFAKFHITYEQSAKPKSDLYTNLLPLLNSARIDLLNHPKLINQLVVLERRTPRGGRESIDHAPGAKDDVCNAVAGLASIIVSPYGAYDHTYRGFAPDADDDDPDGARAQRQMRFLQHIRNSGYLGPIQ